MVFMTRTPNPAFESVVATIPITVATSPALKKSVAGSGRFASVRERTAKNRFNLSGNGAAQLVCFPLVFGEPAQKQGKSEKIGSV